MKQRLVGLLLGGVISLAATAAAAQTGQSIYQQRCAACHALTPGAAKMGPPLGGILGKRMGAAPDYAYSTAMKKGGVVWTREELDAFLAAPAKRLPGTRMMIGAPDPKQRKAIIDFLAATR